MVRDRLIDVYVLYRLLYPEYNKLLAVRLLRLKI